jgi:hypothetical protein
LYALNRHWDDEMKEVEMGIACSMHALHKYWVQNLKDWGRLVEVGVVENILFKIELK